MSVLGFLSFSINLHFARETTSGLQSGEHTILTNRRRVFIDYRHTDIDVSLTARAQLTRS